MTDNFKIHGTVDKDFTKVPKAIIRDKSISADARIILAFLIDLTGDFSVNERGLSSILGISLFKVGKAISELETAGYISKRRIMNGSRFAGWFWDISVCQISNSNFSYPKNSDMEKSDANNSDANNSDMKNSDMNFSDSENQLYIKDRKDLRPTDTRLEEDKTKVEETEEREIALTLTPIYQAEETVLSSAEVNTIQAFNRFCEVYPRLGNRDQARAAFLAIPDINNICWQIANSVEWFEKSKKWDNWQTGQKNVSCPYAVKFLQRGDWQEYLKSDRTLSFRERMESVLSKENEHGII